MGSENSVQLDLYNPAFPATWERHILYDLSEWVNGMAFRNIHFTAAGKPIIKIAEIKNGISGQTKFTDSEYDSIYHITEGDMLFSWSGQPETSIDVFWWHGPDGWLNQHIFKVFPKEICERTFFYYMLKYLKPNFIRIARNKQTTGLGHVTKKDMRRISIGVPLLSEQRAIAHILGSLDDKIELNRRMNTTLEAMARAIFKSWFVDFDPVRARRGDPMWSPTKGADTKVCPYMTPEILDLFPDSFEDSELGQIPKGWEIKTIGEVVEFAYGKALKASNRKPGNVPVFGSNGPVGLHNEVLVKGPGIVIGRKGNPGIVTWSSIDFFPIDTTFYVKPKSEILSLHYLFYALDAQDLPSLSADSAVPGLNRNMAYMNSFLVPPSKILPAFDQQVVPLFDKIVANENESRTLASLRDTLLPKLISGELRVLDAEKVLEDMKWA
jgi:type I restriction enzyme S subunit